MSYEYRRGGRSDSEFKRDIKERTDTERRAAASLVLNWLRKESPKCKLEDHGCGNDGQLLREGVTQQADFKLRDFGGCDYLLEMKVSSAPCVTLKEDQVKTFVGYGDRTDVLVDWCLNFEKPNETHYLTSPETSLILFRDFGRYGAHDGFGGKSGWRLYQRELDQLAAEHPMSRFSNRGGQREYAVFYKAG